MINLAKKLWPINRSLTGEGFRESLKILKSDHLEDLQIKSVDSGSAAFDWTVPDEWKVSKAVLKEQGGEVICDFAVNNLHLLGYSAPFKGVLSYQELEPHLYTLPDHPDWIPYVTSYYKKRWGFCISENTKKNMNKNTLYEVDIEAELFPGKLNYGELVIPGLSKKEIVFSTYLCHPSMANNELSGPVVSTFLAKSLKQKQLNYTYRFLFVPETIGSIAYISKNFEHLKSNLLAGFILTCIGDERAYSILTSRKGDTIADRAVKAALDKMPKDAQKIEYSFLDRGSDERQFCSPMVDLPFASIMRSKYGVYPEYHTSADNFDLVTEKGLRGGLSFAQAVCDYMEGSRVYENIHPCEPQLGKRGLYPTLSTKSSGKEVRNMMNFIAYCDGKTELKAISDHIKVPEEDLKALGSKLSEAGVLRSF